MTDKQLETLILIVRHWRRWGLPPTLRALARALDLRGPSSVQSRIDLLRADGYIDGMTPTEKALALKEVQDEKG